MRKLQRFARSKKPNNLGVPLRHFNIITVERHIPLDKWYKVITHRQHNCLPRFTSGRHGYMFRPLKYVKLILQLPVIPDECDQSKTLKYNLSTYTSNIRVLSHTKQ